MSLYAEYYLEREGISTIEREHGFCTYKITNEECYIIDLYVKKEHRKSRIASEMADEIAEIAKSKGCKYLTGTVYTNTNGATTSTKILLAYGFDIHACTQDKIIFIKELQ